MDNQQFDILVRRLAKRGGRRGLLRGLIGGVAAGVVASTRGGSAAAQDCCYLGPGDACDDDRQCIPPINAYYQPMFCADNGFDYDGPLNCCAWEGYWCFSDEGCCGSLACVDSVCQNPVSTGYPARRGYPANTGWASLGDFCTDQSDCSQSFPELGWLSCADNGFGYEICCREAGGSCGGPLAGPEHDWLCCGELSCFDGRCGLG